MSSIRKSHKFSYFLHTINAFRLTDARPVKGASPTGGEHISVSVPIPRRTNNLDLLNEIRPNQTHLAGADLLIRSTQIQKRNGSLIPIRVLGLAMD